RRRDSGGAGSTSPVGGNPPCASRPWVARRRSPPPGRQRRFSPNWNARKDRSMKRLPSILIAIISFGFGALVVRQFSHHETEAGAGASGEKKGGDDDDKKGSREGKKESGEGKKEAGGLTIKPDAQRRVGLVAEPLAPAVAPREAVAFGSVLDPSAL